MATNPIRFGGMASGMDTESIVKQMMQTRRLKVDSLGQRKAKLEWKMDAYQQVNKSLANFILDSRKKLGFNGVAYTGKLYPGAINKTDWAKKATTTGTDFTATATSGATNGDLNVSVKQLATGATITGAATTTKSTDVVGSDTTLKLNVNGEEKTVNLLATDTISEAMNKIRTQAGINISYGKVGSDANKNELSIAFLSSKQTGKSESINATDASTTAFFEKIGISTATMNAGAKGQNSIVTINGTSDVENATNNISISGINLTLNNVSATGTSQKITVSANTDDIFNKIKTFVEDYNKIIGELQGKMSEKGSRSYMPLTKEQKADMSENDVKLWEEKAKTGLLQNDTTINGMLSKTRAGLYEKVEGSGALFEIGIATGNYKDGAKLNIDENKLKKAIAEDPQKVLDTLFKTPDDIARYKPGTAEDKAQRAQTGVFVRIMDDMANGMQDIASKSGAGKDSDLLKSVRTNILTDLVLKGQEPTLTKDMRLLDKTIDRENMSLNRYEDMLWKKFTAMEKAIQQIQGQSGWLSQQFGR